MAIGYAQHAYSVMQTNTSLPRRLIDPQCSAPQGVRWRHRKNGLSLYGPKGHFPIVFEGVEHDR